MRPSHHTMAIAMFWREWVMRLLREMVAYAAFALTPHPDMGLHSRRRAWQVPKLMSRLPSHLNCVGSLCELG